MGAPSVSSYSDSFMTLSWTALVAPATGNSDITAYELYWDNALGTVNILLTSTTATSYTVSGLTGGSTY